LDVCFGNKKAKYLIDNDNLVIDVPGERFFYMLVVKSTLINYSVIILLKYLFKYLRLLFIQHSVKSVNVQIGMDVITHLITHISTFIIIMNKELTLS